MRVFAAIATFAAIAFSTVVSAAPVHKLGGTRVGTDIAGIKEGVDIVALETRDVPADLEYQSIAHNPEPYNRRGEGSLLDIMADVNLAGLGISVDIDVLQARGYKAPAPQPEDVIAHLQAIIEEIRVEVTAIIDAGGSDLLTVNGAAVSVQVAAQIVVDFVVKITTVIGAIIKSCGPDDKSAVLAVVAHIYATISVIICAVIDISADIRVEVLAVIKAHISSLLAVDVDINLRPLLQGLGL